MLRWMVMGIGSVLWIQCTSGNSDSSSPSSNAKSTASAVSTNSSTATEMGTSTTTSSAQGSTTTVGGSTTSSTVVSSRSTSATDSDNTEASSGSGGSTTSSSTTGGSADATYSDVKDILQNRCYVCHTVSRDLRSYANVMNYVVAGNADGSPLYKRLKGIGGALMPQGGPAIPTDEQDIIKEWIDLGAANN